MISPFGKGEQFRVSEELDAVEKKAMRPIKFGYGVAKIKTKGDLINLVRGKDAAPAGKRTKTRS